MTLTLSLPPPPATMPEQEEREVRRKQREAAAAESLVLKEARKAQDRGLKQRLMR